MKKLLRVISVFCLNSITIVHTVEDASGCYKDEVVLTIQIYHLPPPIANFTFVGQAVCDNGLIVFADASQYAETWLWDFGDGATSNLQNPTHAYTTSGTYTVTLTVSNGCGSDVETQFVVANSTVFDYTVPFSMTLQQAINLGHLPNQTTIQVKNIFINGQLTITNATPFWELATCNVTMAPGAGITVGSGSTFKIVRYKTNTRRLSNFIKITNKVSLVNCTVLKKVSGSYTTYYRKHGKPCAY